MRLSSREKIVNYPAISRAFTIICLLTLLGSVAGAQIDESPQFQEASAALKHHDVSFLTEDDLTIHGTIFPGTMPKAVVLLHMLDRQRSDWEALANKLQTDGYYVLSLDLRGHGQSVMHKGEKRTYKQFKPADYIDMTKDLEAALVFLKERYQIRSAQTAVMGASIGANVAIRHAAEKPGVRVLVLLSPGLNYRGLLTEKEIAKLGGLALLIVASEDDRYSAQSSRRLFEETGVLKELKMLENAGHGTRMLTNQPDLETYILNWIKEVL